MLSNMNTAHIIHEFIYIDFPAPKARCISVIQTRLNSHFLTPEKVHVAEFLKRVIKLLIILNFMLYGCSPKAFY